jgi:hypothetical protein
LGGRSIVMGITANNIKRAKYHEVVPLHIDVTNSLSAEERLQNLRSLLCLPDHTLIYEKVQSFLLNLFQIVKAEYKLQDLQQKSILSFSFTKLVYSLF